MRHALRLPPAIRLALLTLACAACGGGGGGSGGGGGGGGASNVIGAAGGTYDFLGGAVRLQVPAGAVAADTTVTVAAATAPAGATPAPVDGTFFTFSPDGTTFAHPVTLTLRYDPARLPAGTDPATMQLAKATADGWEGHATTVDAGAHTVSAEVQGFSSWGVTPGLGTVAGTGGAPDAQARAFAGWLGVSDAMLATDPAGAVYLLGLQNYAPPGGGGGPLGKQGTFLARLNANLSIQWVRELPASPQVRYLAVDQQGNAFVLHQSEFIDLQGYRLVLTSYNPSGGVRAGFPIAFGTPTAVAVPSGLAIDAIGQAYVFGLTAGLNQFVYTPVFGVYGNSGAVIRAPAAFSIPMLPGTTNMQQANMTLDFNGRIYFETSCLTNSGGGTVVSAVSATNLAAVSGFPVTLTSEFSVGFAQPVNGAIGAPLLQVSLPTLVGAGGGALHAFDALSGGESSGFPAAIADAGPEFAAVDATGVTWVVGRQTSGGPHRLWVRSFAPGGAGRGAARIYQVAAASSDDPLGATVDPAGTLYVALRSSYPAADTEFRVLAVPAL